MLEAFQFAAIFCSAIFAGAALYINLVEHPARMQCGTGWAATVFPPSYKRAILMQVTLLWLSSQLYRPSFAGGLSDLSCGSLVL